MLFEKRMLQEMTQYISLSLSKKLLKKYQSKINMNDSIGPEYFARQILMKEKLVKVVPIERG